ncbi:MAG: type II toxin-antitoxin system RelE family toxin [Bacteroidota bacterium]
MQVEISRKFQKQLLKISDKKLRLIVFKIIESVETAGSIGEIKNVKKLVGFRNYYRIRQGNYRIGIRVENDTVIFSAFDHRSDIYKYFP